MTTLISTMRRSFGATACPAPFSWPRMFAPGCGAPSPSASQSRSRAAGRTLKAPASGRPSSPAPISRTQRGADRRVRPGHPCQSFASSRSSHLLMPPGQLTNSSLTSASTSACRPAPCRLRWPHARHIASPLVHIRRGQQHLSSCGRRLGYRAQAGRTCPLHGAADGRDFAQSETGDWHAGSGGARLRQAMRRLLKAHDMRARPSPRRASCASPSVPKRLLAPLEPPFRCPNRSLKHALVQEAAYESLLNRTRQLHGRADTARLRG